ncbi:MAG: hypothetical protein Q4D26_00735 [Clostridia bacterium]|nr:hypothetical protein [Clostridia bacterium]
MYGDYLRGKLDEIKAYDIYNDIKSITDSAEDKPTVFIGASESYKLPFDIKYGIESIFVHDILTNNYLARETINFRIYPYFRMLGLPLAEADDVLYTKCLAMANDMPSYPKDGYIKENNEAIVVKLGDIEEIVPVTDISLGSGNIRAKMDTFNLSDNILNVSGWAILENAPVNRVKKKLLITKRDTGEKYIYNCGNVSRRDVVNKLGLYDDFEYCGYFGYINTEKFENGNYTVQLILDLYGQLYSTDIFENMEINIK